MVKQLVFLYKRASSSTILKGAVSAFLVKVLGAGGGFLFNIVIARKLGVEQAGYFFLMQAIAVFMGSICRQGFDSALVRNIASYGTVNEEQNIVNLTWYAFKRVLYVSLLCAMFISLFSPFISDNIFNSPNFSSVLKIGSWLIIPLAIAPLMSFCFQGKKKVALAMFYQAAGLNLISMIVFWLISPTSSSFAVFIYLICSTVIAVFSVFHWKKQHSEKATTIIECEKVKVLSSIKPLFWILFLTQFSTWAGQLILGVWGSPSDVALFATALRTAMLPGFVLVAVNSIAAPKFAEDFRNSNIKGLHKTSLQSGRMMVIAVLPILAIMMIFAPWIMSLFGSEFIPAANILRILVLGQFINVITGAVAYLLQMTGYETVLRNNMLISCVVLVLGLLIMTPFFGAFGAAIITAISVATQNLLCVYHVKKHLGFNTMALWKNI